MSKYTCPDCPAEFNSIGPVMDHREETGHVPYIVKRQKTIHEENLERLRSVKTEQGRL